jgi:hypothetical protein
MVASRAVKRTLIPLALLAIAATPHAEPADDLHARAMRLHRSAIVVDTHEDVPYWLEERAGRTSGRDSRRATSTSRG